MSHRDTNLVWKHSRARGGAFLTLLAIADFINSKETTARPFISTIAAKCRMGRRTVERHLATLKRIGELDWEVREGTSSLYRITVTSANLAEVDEEDEASELAEGPADLARRYANGGGGVPPPVAYRTGSESVLGPGTESDSTEADGADAPSRSERETKDAASEVVRRVSTLPGVTKAEAFQAALALLPGRSINEVVEELPRYAADTVVI